MRGDELTGGPGRLTISADAKAQEARSAIWDELARVARPDSRFHYDFSSFIADFEGSEICADRVRRLDAYEASPLIFITPDNSTEALRKAAMVDGKPFLMTTYGIGRGFLHLDPSDVPAAERSCAATLDGMDRYAKPVSLAEIRRLPKVGMLATGGSAVNQRGIRFGKGHGYFDLEWAILSEIGSVSAQAEIVDVVHDCQVVDDELEAQDHDVAVDWIVTPTTTRRVTGHGRRPGKVRWDLLADSPLRHVPPIVELSRTSTADVDRH